MMSWPELIAEQGTSDFAISTRALAEAAEL
jgi:hypothetical protein